MLTCFPFSLTETTFVFSAISVFILFLLIIFPSNRVASFPEIFETLILVFSHTYNLDHQKKFAERLFQTVNKIIIFIIEIVDYKMRIFKDIGSV